jgi:ELWxxDGT repeat protein
MSFIIRVLLFVYFVQVSSTAYGQISKPIYSFNEYNEGLYRIQNFISFKDKLYFIAQSSQQQADLYQTDGTSFGTKKLSQQGFGFLYYINSNSDYALFDSDKGLLMTMGGEPTLVSSQTGSALGLIYFLQAGSDTDLRDVWVSDGTSIGTKRVIKDILPGSFSTLNGEVYFTNRFGDNLYKYKQGATVLVGNIMARNGIQVLGTTKTKIFINSNSQIWITDGTSLESIAPTNSNFIPLYHVVGDKLYFVDRNQVLNVTKGIVGDIVPIQQFYSFQYVIGKIGDKVILSNGILNTATDTFTTVDFSSTVLAPDSNSDHFYALNDSSCYTRIFRYSASDLSKTLVKVLNGKLEGQGIPIGGTVAGKTVFPFNDYKHGIELWVTDGTSSGTTLLKDLVTSPNSSTNIYNWVLGKGKYYFYTDTYISFHKYTDLWSLDSLTNIPTRLHSFCDSPLPPPIQFKENIYFSDNSQLLQFNPSSRTIKSVFSRPDLEPVQILASNDALFMGVSNANFQELVFGSLDERTFNSMGSYSLDGATVIQETLYQLTKGYDSLYLFKSNGISGPLKKVKGIDLVQNVFSASVVPFGSSGLLITEQTYNNNQKAFYFDNNQLKVIVSDLGHNGYPHLNDFLQYGDTVFFRVLDIGGSDKYYQYLKSMVTPRLLFTTPTNSHSSLIGSGSNHLYYLVNNAVMKFNLSSSLVDTISMLSGSTYKSIKSSFRNGSSLLFQDDSYALYFVNTDKNIFLPIDIVSNAPFIASDKIIYFSKENTIWEINPIYLITDVQERMQEYISLYPNPTIGGLLLSNMEVALEVFSLEGIKFRNFTASKEFDVSTLQTGMYIAKLTAFNGQIYYQRFIKE